MIKTILGRKLGMTQIFGDKGELIPVTVIEAGPCAVVQVKRKASDGYDALQIGFGEKKEARTIKPDLGRFKKAGVKAKKYLREIPFGGEKDYKEGQEIKADIFNAGDKVDVSALSKGKGFAGSIKKYGQGRGPMSHGSHYHRGPGSLGAVDPARVFKGRPLPGRMGGNKVTVLNLEIARVDAERNLILIKGAVPGPKDGLVTIRSSVKK
ncbi:MAG TPA: 50S ribosomal protein L3 [Firmicutes bacterium]|nr:50S ribosomal protein L3 [Bacillota bacterium]